MIFYAILNNIISAYVGHITEWIEQKYRQVELYTHIMKNYAKCISELVYIGSNISTGQEKTITLQGKFDYYWIIGIYLYLNILIMIIIILIFKGI